jgi:hypothetical protein
MMQSAEKMIKATVTLVMRAGYRAGVIAAGPIKTAKHAIAIAIERSWPNDRTVAFIPEAIPRCRFATELMMALVLGEEKMP